MIFQKKTYYFIGFLIFILCTPALKAQAPKKLFVAKRTSTAPVIDGNLNDPIWQYSTLADEFVQYLPYNGAKADQKTEVRVLYDDRAIYFSAQMFDNNPDSIFSELGLRDQGLESNSDYFIIELSPFNNGINSSVFMVTASGIQSDAKLSDINIDYKWDAVWESAVKIGPNGWTAEIKIPYAALRFPKRQLQVWGVNFMRKVKRTEQTSSWNFIDIEVNGWPKQSGELIGILNISPPLRFSITPYVLYNRNFGETQTTKQNEFHYGLDFKYGINQSFTLDMILVPDFTQIQEDDKQINLTPYEIKYEERRAFFTESSEIFSKGNIYYSKRIGQKPENYYRVAENLQPNEVIINNPTTTPLINATKFSGRTTNGLGIGVLNAVTNRENAQILDTINNSIRIEQTQDIRNYNLVVFDKNLKNNSFVSVSNTNVKQNGFFSDVVSSEFFFTGIKGNYAFSGLSSASFKKDTLNFEAGHRYELAFEKISGRFQFGLQTEQLSDNFDPNDMGYLKRNNETAYQLNLDYKLSKPYGTFLAIENSFYIKYAKLYSNSRFFNLKLEYSNQLTFKNNASFQIILSAKPKGYIDYFESRNTENAYRQSAQYYVELEHTTTPKRPLQVGLYGMYWFSTSVFHQTQYILELNPKWFVSKKLSISPIIRNEQFINEIGYITSSDNTIFYGKRTQLITTNTLSSDYVFNKKHSISLRARYYWGQVVYNQTFKLQANGTLVADNGIGIANTNYNVWNVDAVYQWQFAKGSMLSLWWKQAISDNNQNLNDGFFYNLNQTLLAKSGYLFSVKLIYYIDANGLRSQDK